MTHPDGIRTESMWTPSASRAGALHSHIHSHLHRQNLGPKAPSIVTAVDASRPATMDGRFAASFGGRR